MLVPIFMFIHGTSRIVHGAVRGFGEFLGSHGLPLGVYVAWGITIFEIVGSLSLMAGYFVFVIAMIFVIELTVRITLVHSASGWFVVGGGTGGMEYSVLLIVSFLLIAATSGKPKLS